jgi:glycosyltransferase involved in cell wall biosynthesis
MHVLFVHKVFPGHFGHVAARLVRDEGIECTFVYNRLPPGVRTAQAALPRGGSNVTDEGASSAGNDGGDVRVAGIRVIPYQSRGASRETHPDNLHFEISAWHRDAVSQVLAARPDVRPDLIVGHAGYGTALSLARFYGCPMITYCEYYHAFEKSHLRFRPDFPPSEAELRSRHAFNAVNLLAIEEADACYAPTDWQRSVYPVAYQPKIRTIFDGIDRDFWYRREVPRHLAGLPPIPTGMRVVTYCSYGLEPTRGFDIFMRMAKRICDARSDVVFVVVGDDRSYYGASQRDGGSRSFREFVLAQDRYDLSRFCFTGQIPEERLVELLSLSDLHVYLTVPFVLSWSLMDAMACGCTVLASDTAPVREVVAHDQNGLLAGFHDVDELASQALRVLADPAQFRHLGEAATRLIDEKYSLDRTLPLTADLYRRVVSEANAPAPDAAQSG